MPAPLTEHGLPTSGTTAQRPTNAEIGFRYFDTSLNMPLMWDGTRWIKGDFEAVLVPVDAATVIAVGDLVYYDTDDAKPAASQADSGTEAGNQEAFHDKFLGVALQASATDATDPILVATRGRFTFTCPSGTFEPGALVGADENGGGTALLNTTVASVATANLAVGRVAVRVGSAATSVQVDIESTIMYGGPQTMM